MPYWVEEVIRGLTARRGAEKRQSLDLSRGVGAGERKPPVAQAVVQEPGLLEEPAFLFLTQNCSQTGFSSATERGSGTDRLSVPVVAVRIIPAPIVIITAGISRVPSSGLIVEADVRIVVYSHPSIPGSPPSVIVNVRVLKSRIFRATP